MSEQRTRIARGVSGIRDSDLLTLIRAGQDFPITIRWKAAIAQILDAVTAAREAMVRGFSDAQHEFEQMLQWTVEELDNKPNTSEVNALIAAETQARLAAASTDVAARNAAITSAVNAEAAARSYADTNEGQARIAGDALRVQMFGADGQITNPKEYSSSKATAASVAVFYLTSTGLVTGTALFAAISKISCSVNDAATLYTFGWVLSADKKTLTVTAKRSNTPVLSLLNINILQAPTPAPDGTLIQVTVTGN